VTWRAVMPADDLWIGEMLGVEVDGVPVLLVNAEEGLRAYLDRCPHQATRLSEGDLDGRTLTCRAHVWEFDAVSGCGINPASARLTPFPVRVVDGVIQVRLPDRSEITDPPQLPLRESPSCTRTQPG
jgi:toluene monooxygenase system ferredoxin subunit